MIGRGANPRESQVNRRVSQVNLQENPVNLRVNPVNLLVNLVSLQENPVNKATNRTCGCGSPTGADGTKDRRGPNLPKTTTTTIVLAGNPTVTRVFTNPTPTDHRDGPTTDIIQERTWTS